MTKLYVGLFYGLGGATWSGGMETILRPKILKIPSVICPPARSHVAVQSMIDEIKALPKDVKVAVGGHSMGGGSATRITDHCHVHLLFLYDIAGSLPSRLGKNCDKCYDIHDVIPDMVPDGPAFRPQVVPGYEKAPDGTDRIERWVTYDGHTGIDDDPILANKIVAHLRTLAA